MPWEYSRMAPMGWRLPLAVHRRRPITLWSEARAIDTTSPPSQFLPFGISDKVHPQTLDIPTAPYTYAAQPQAMLNVDPTSELSFPSDVSHGADMTFIYNNSAGPDAMYSHWTI